MVHVSVIGCGHMGGALVRGLSAAGHRVTACDVDESVLEDLSGVADETTTDLEAAASAPIVVLAVGPDAAGEVLADLELDPDQTVVSVAAGVSTSMLESTTDAAVIRMMPNLAAEYGEMAAAVTPEPTGDVATVLDDLGTVVTIDEDRMDLATAINGSGPAFVFYLIGAMQQAGIEGGLDSDDAAALAAQTFKGAAEIVLQSDESVEELVDAVATEGGTTIEGMEVLWDSDVEDVLGETVAVTEERSAEITAEIGDE
ncbi:pyrroline-5-carboxylate reductase dimerization domain-containing protein [Halorhabdus sp. BNX81]|uniref:pyrroline-5-carboxylate reductase family protein n=1 Tax=Halorhabdus sp. BNX81 TaxID=2980181 RepID=UPI0023DD2548|nr:pyrroline-5-carboxylate reductase dimerization domain-containing protein [Halorhabdus sp. BNX81]WEL20321.1 Pyrroline-5-carboxylate reductase [Halorhabdus sp. BNX81]